MADADVDLYDVGMAVVHRSLRLPRWLWEAHKSVAGDHTADILPFLLWRPRNVGVELGPDVDTPYEFTATIRVDEDVWNAFLAAVPEDEGSAEVRRYIWARVQDPGARLPELCAA